MSKITIEVSARHVHISQKDLEVLFGKGYNLIVYKKLSQPGQFAAKETITVKTKEGELQKVRILGPVRDHTQVEVSMTDARKLKIKVPLRLSGDIKGTPGATLIGPEGKMKIKKGVIVAKRHIHTTPKQAKKIGLSDGQVVSVKTPGERGITFHDVSVRVRDDFDLNMHIDTDEGNASLPDGVYCQGEIII